MAFSLAVPAIFFFLAIAIIAIIINAFIIHLLSKAFKFELAGFVRAFEISALVGLVNFVISLGMFIFRFDSYIGDTFLFLTVILATYLFSKQIYKESAKVTIYFTASVIALDVVVGVLAAGLVILFFNMLNIPFF